MKDRFLQAEIWETQVILYWILSVLLFQNNHDVLGYITLIWGVISMIGVFLKLILARLLTPTQSSGGDKIK